MKYIISLFATLVSVSILLSQEDFNIELVSNIQIDEECNDIWGYVDDNDIEYAILGSMTKVSIFSLEDPSNPILRAEIPGVSSLWRDMKDYNGHIYVTADQGSDGLGIIDMSLAPEEITYSFWQPTLTVSGFSSRLRTCHNLYIDEAGYCYLAGCNIPSQFNTNGVIILDLNQNPKEPVFVGDITGAYSHDVIVRGDTLYSSDFRNGEFTIYDVSDKANPTLLGSRQTSSGSTHNAWMSEDGKYLYTSDEVENAYIDCYDISDMNNIFQTDRYRPLETAGNGIIPHNVHYIDDYLVTSWYTDGLVIMDVSDPYNIIKVGAYDTFQDEASIQGRWFKGLWGAYPWLPSGHILGSDINTGLYVFKPTYQRASRIEGTITNIDDNAAISNAKVRIINRDVALSTSDPNGNYSGGDVLDGEVEIEYSHPLYKTDTISVSLVNGESINIDAQLTPLVRTIEVNIIDPNGNPIPNASVLIVNGVASSVLASTDDTGTVYEEILDEQTVIYASAWGYKMNTIIIQGNIDKNIQLVLHEGYHDNFFFDHGWTSISNASSGRWERGNPIGTAYLGAIANPEADVSNDIGGRAYVTGNGGGSPDDDDVNGGTVTLRSAVMDLTTYTNPELSFAYWFFNAGGNSTPNDQLDVVISNGVESVIAFSTNESNSMWIEKNNLFISDYITNLSEVYVEFITSDAISSNHIVESGIDLFEINDNAISNVDQIRYNQYQLVIYPNPTSNLITITSDHEAIITIIDIMGQVICTYDLHEDRMLKIPTKAWQKGLYLVKSEYKNGMKTLNPISVK